MTGDLWLALYLTHFLFYIILRLTHDWHVFPVAIYQSDRNYVIVHLICNSIGQEMADAIVAQPRLLCN